MIVKIFYFLYTYFVQIAYIQGRRSRGFQGGTCTPAFLPSPGIFEVHNGTHSTHIPRNSPPRRSAPPLFRPV